MCCWRLGQVPKSSYLTVPDRTLCLEHRLIDGVVFAGEEPTLGLVSDALCYAFMVNRDELGLSYIEFKARFRVEGGSMGEGQVCGV